MSGLLLPICLVLSILVAIPSLAENSSSRIFAGDVCSLPAPPPDFVEFTTEMKRRIYRNLPSSMSFSKEITVKFFVTPDGFIRDAIIQNSSENKDIDLTCLDAIYSSSPLPPPPPLRKVPPPPPAGLLLPPRYFGIGVYLFTFSKSDTPRRKSVPRFEYLVIPREVIYRYPETFSLAELDSEQNKLLPKPFVNIEDARSQWAQFYKMHPTATKKEILDWSRLVDQFYSKTDTDNENWPPPFQPSI